MSDIVVNINNLSRRFGDTLALNDIDFKANSGGVYGLVGANGAGKTTLIKHMMGLLRASGGTVQLFGLDPVVEPVSVLKRIGYLSEERDIPDWMSINELMRYTQAYHVERWDNDYANELLATFSLDPSKKISDLSRGMRAQVALISAVAHKPDLLILDEPSSGLDAIVRQDILNAVVRTISEEGRTVIFSSHLLEEVEQLADHITVLNQGQVVLEGSLESINSAHHHSEIHFAEPRDAIPLLQDAITCTGDGRSWSVIHVGAFEAFANNVSQLGGEIADSRHATLEEIFVARIGRETRGEAV